MTDEKGSNATFALSEVVVLHTLARICHALQSDRNRMGKS